MDIVEVREGDVIEPPLSIDEQLRLHCEWQEKDHTNGDYFHGLAKAALAEITALRRRVEELEGALAESCSTLAVAFDRVHSLPRTTDTDLANRIAATRAKIAALRAKGGGNGE